MDIPLPATTIRRAKKKVKIWTSADAMTFFWGLHLIWVKNWTSADTLTFKEPVLLLRRENMVTLEMIYFWGYTSESMNYPRVPMNRKFGKPWCILKKKLATTALKKVNDFCSQARRASVVSKCMNLTCFISSL